MVTKVHISKMLEDIKIIWLHYVLFHRALALPNLLIDVLRVELRENGTDLKGKIPQSE